MLLGLLAADPSSCCVASSIWSGNPHPTHTILLLSRPTCPDRQHDTFRRNHWPCPPIKHRPQPFCTQYNMELSSIWQRRSKSRPHARTRSLWLPCVPTARSWRSTSASRPPLNRHAVVYFKAEFVLFSRGHHQCLLVICPL